MWQTATKPEANPKLPLLVSYAFLREMPERQVEWIFSHPEVECLVDSGAFSALNAGMEIRLDEYLQFLDRWKDKLFGYIALDKIGDPKTTDANLKEMIKQGFSPRPVHVRGDDEKRMDELFELSDWVFLGGLRRPHRGAAPNSYIKQKMVWAKGRNVHWLGYTKQEMVLGFKPYSVDCSSVFAAPMYGRVKLYLGRMEWTDLSLQGLRRDETIVTSKVRAACERYGVRAEALFDPSSWRHNVSRGIPTSKFVSFQLSVRSWVQYAFDLRRSTGTRLFIACATDEKYFKSLLFAADYHTGTNYIQGDEWSWLL